MTSRDMARFFKLVAYFPDDCWEWRGGLTARGYGRFQSDGIRKYAHVVMFELFNGPVPSGMELDHLCKKKSCVKPSHLEAVSHRINVLRGESPAANYARRTHCKMGHELTEENIYKHRKSRDCKICQRAKNRGEYG